MWWLRTLVFGAVLLALLALPLSAFADTRVSLSRDAVALGESVTLTIETDQPIASPQLAPLRRDFALGGIDSAREINLSGGRMRTTQRIRVQLRPLHAGMLQIPPLAIGNQRSAPLLLEVTAGAAQSPQAPARASSASTQANGPVFIDTVLDDDTPYVQQAVGVTVRLHYAINLFNGEFRQPEPAQGGSLQPVGSDSRSMRVVEGRQYQVLERHYLLVPERSGMLQLPGASFRGEAQSGIFDGLFGDGREAVSAQASSRSLGVRAIPAQAGRPWLPARQVSMQLASPPTQARAGEAFDVVVELRADGATAAQLPELNLHGEGAQVFAQPAQPTEGFSNGRAQVVLTRRFSVLPQHPGALQLQVTPVEWWDVAADAPRRADVPPIRLQVAPGQGRYANPAASAPVAAGDAASMQAQAGQRRAIGDRLANLWPWLLAGIAALIAGAVLWRRRPRARDVDAASDARGDAHDHRPGERRAASASTTASSAADRAASTSTPNTASAMSRRQRAEAASMARPGAEFQRAVREGDLAAVARLLPRLAEPPVADLAAARAMLDDEAQREASLQLERALWGAGDAEAARIALRHAFARGPRWRTPEKARKPLLPPLYPE